MYSFDVAWEDRASAARYLQLMRSDMAKARLDQGGTADVYALAFVTHPHGRPRNLPGVIKYLDRIDRAARMPRAADLRKMAAQTIQRALSSLGHVRSGSLQGGAAFDVEVTIDYWLVGPERAPGPS